MQVTEEEKLGLVAFLRTKTPKANPPTAIDAPAFPCADAGPSWKLVLCDYEGNPIRVPGLSGGVPGLHGGLDAGLHGGLDASVTLTPTRATPPSRQPSTAGAETLATGGHLSADSGWRPGAVIACRQGEELAQRPTCRCRGLALGPMRYPRSGL